MTARQYNSKMLTSVISGIITVGLVALGIWKLFELLFS